ncbi:MAG TPA: putative Ig domain-containing protein [Candidatus Krumholzibacteriaceae bacterium]|nr:putative Ig domain-containing protein [Candidatus Krumholzibacteriaceae bacterium]
MRKVFLVLLVLSLSGMFISCSEDEDTVTPTPEPEELAITTDATLETGYTCSPYSVQMEAENGTEPYTWSLDSVSHLPAGMELSSDGTITGVTESAGSYNFNVVCTDDEGATDVVCFSFEVDVPNNPSIAIFFDEEASVCSGDVTYPSVLDCYAYIMLDENESMRGATFKVNLVDSEGSPLESGFVYTYTSIPEYALKIGDISNGIAIAFNRAVYPDGGILLCSFGLMLTEDLDELAFDIVANPTDPGDNGNPKIVDKDHVEATVPGRKSAVNY